jgi:hypothetical protein
MAMKGSGGGGYGSRVVTERPVRTGSGSFSTTPGYVGQLGNKQGSHVTRGEDSTYRGEPMHVGRTLPTMFGNGVAARTQCGPGGSREVLPSGGQGTHGGVNRGNPRPVPSRHIIESYGPDYRRPGNPHRSDTDADF